MSAEEPQPPKIERKEVRWMIHPDLVDCLDQLLVSGRGRLGSTRGQILEQLAWRSLDPLIASGQVIDPAKRNG